MIRPGQLFSKRIVVVALAVAIFLSSAVAVAKTGTTSLTGTSEWSQQFSPELGLVTTTQIQGTFDGALGKGTYAGTLIGEGSFTTTQCGPVCQSVTGHITFSSPRGDLTAVVEPGSLVALTDIASHSWRSFALTVRVVSGTRSYRHADGVLSLAYVSEWIHTFIDGEFINEIADSGQLSGNPR